MQTLVADLRYTLRSLRKSPGFAAVVILTLALGIGANAAIFSVVDGVLLRPLGFRDAGQLVRVTGDFTKAGQSDTGLDTVLLNDYRSRTDLFQGVAGVYPINVNLTNVEVPERIEGQLVSANFFTVLGVDAAAGRVFGDPDGEPGNATLVVISDSLWRRRFGADPDTIGRSIRLDNDLYTVIGILPASFRYPGATIVSEPEAFVPAGFADTPFNKPVRGQFTIFAGAIARLAPGLTVDAAQVRLREFGATIASTYPAAYRGQLGWVPRLVTLRDDVTGSVRPALVLLMAAVGALLLIACANVASLLLARASARHREFAIRASLGASRGRLLRQLLTESLTLSLAGAVSGLAVLWMLKRAFLAAVPAGLPRADSIAVDGRVLAFTIGLALVTGLLFGMWPAIQSSLASPQDALKDSGRSNTASAARTRVRSVLVAAEMAMAVVLLVVAALLGRAFLDFYRAEAGFTPDHVLSAQLWMPVPNDPTSGPYFSHPQRLAFLRTSLDRIRAIPGLDGAAWVSQLPVGRSATTTPFLVEGDAPATTPTNRAQQTVVTDGYFETMRIPVLGGRAFTPADDTTKPPVVVVSQSFVRRYFPNANPIGRRLRFGAATPAQPWYTIIGVVGDVHDSRPGIAPPAQFYRSMLQFSNLSMALVVRTQGDPTGAAQALTTAIRSADPELPAFGIRPLVDVMAASLAQRRFTMTIVAVFAVIALGLAAIGIYGVLAYLVEQRRAEIGVRLALGATSRDIMRLIVGRGVLLAAIGEVVGLAGAFAAARAVSRAIAGVVAFDPIAFGGIAVVLALVAVAACALPAWRATRILPLTAIRQE